MGNMHLQDLYDDRTVNHIMAHKHELMDDDYHELIKTGAETLYRIGLKKFEYIAGYRSSTLWSDAAGDNFIGVDAEGKIRGA